MQEIWLIIRTISAVDVVDILIVATPFYLLFALLRESRSHTALWGIITMLVLSFLLYLIALIEGFQATVLIYERFWVIIVLTFLIVFQGELKKGLTDIGRLRIFRVLFTQETQVLEEIIKAVTEMANGKIGALIALERSNSLKPYQSTGTELDALISAEAIRSIFTPYAPLHDGALIVRGERLVAASCILPLTERTGLSKDLGTRHRAAIGLTEETDAVVVVVSEETGAISVASAGRMKRFLEPEELRKRLEIELDLGHEDLEAS